MAESEPRSSLFTHIMAVIIFTLEKGPLEKFHELTGVFCVPGTFVPPTIKGEECEETPRTEDEP